MSGVRSSKYGRYTDDDELWGYGENSESIEGASHRAGLKAIRFWRSGVFGGGEGIVGAEL